MFNLLEVLTPVMTGRDFTLRTDLKRKARYLCYDKDTDQDIIVSITYDPSIGDFDMRQFQDTMKFEQLTELYQHNACLELRCEVRQLPKN